MAKASNITRRSFMGTAAIAGSTLSVPLVNAATAEAYPSQLAELIAKAERAREEHELAIDAEWEAYGRFSALNKHEPILGPVIRGGRREVDGADSEEAFTSLEKDIKAHAHDMRVRLSSIGCDDFSMVDRWEATAIAAADQAVADWLARRDKCGLSAAEQIREECDDNELQASHEILAYRPVSPAEARMKVEWILARTNKGDFSGDDYAFCALLESILPADDEFEPVENDSRWTAYRIVKAGGMS